MSKNELVIIPKIEKYIKEKDQILDVMLKIHLRDFYSSVYNYSDEYIENNMEDHFKASPTSGFEPTMLSLGTWKKFYKKFIKIS